MQARTANDLRLPALWILGVLLATTSPAGAQPTLQDPAHFSVVRTFTMAPGVPRPIGGMRFSADGTLLYVVGLADDNTSGLYRVPVTRNATTQEVTGLGAATKVFGGSNPDPTETDAGLDAGLEFGPAGTFFYTYYPTSFVAQRPGGVTGAERTIDVPGLSSVSGLTFAAARTDVGTGFGYLNVSTGVSSNVYEVPLVASGTAGVWVPNPSAAIRLLARVFRAGPPRVGADGVTAIQYVPAGTFGGDLLYASFNQRELWSVRIDDSTGLPVGGATTPVEDLFATGFAAAPPIGLEFDPLRPNELFVSTWDDVTDADNKIYQIAGFASTAPTTTLPPVPTTTSTSSSTSTSRSTSTSTSTSTSRPTTTSTSTTSSSTSTSRPTTTSSSTSTSRPTTTSTSSSSTSTSRPTTTSTSTSSTSTSSSTSSSTSTSRASTTTGPAATTSTTSTSRPTTTSTSSTSSSSSTSRPTTTSSTTSTSRPTTTSTSSSSTSTSRSTSTSTSTTTSTSRAPSTTTSRPVTTTTLPVVAIRTSSLTMSDRTGPPPSPTRRRLSFKATTTGDPLANAIVVPARSSAGDPTSFGAVLSVVNANGSGERVDVTLPASGWVADGSATTTRGYRWTASSRAAPVTRIVVRANRLRIRAGGAFWAYTLDEPQQGAIAVKLRFGTAAPWCARTPAKSVGTPPTSASFDRVDRFVGLRNAPPPAVCP